MITLSHDAETSWFIVSTESTPSNIQLVDTGHYSANIATNCVIFPFKAIYMIEIRKENWENQCITNATLQSLAY